MTYGSFDDNVHLSQKINSILHAYISALLLFYIYMFIISLSIGTDTPEQTV